MRLSEQTIIWLLFWGDDEATRIHVGPGGEYWTYDGELMVCAASLRAG